jgi:hypothetical protein
MPVNVLTHTFACQFTRSCCLLRESVDSWWETLPCYRQVTLQIGGAVILVGGFLAIIGLVTFPFWLTCTCLARVPPCVLVLSSFLITVCLLILVRSVLCRRRGRKLRAQAQDPPSVAGPLGATSFQFSRAASFRSHPLIAFFLCSQSFSLCSTVCT